MLAVKFVLCFYSVNYKDCRIVDVDVALSIIVIYMNASVL